jgi:nucleoside-diphosphate-sugar epimerase
MFGINNMGNPKILLTGGSGFIGSHFHKYLPAEAIINLDLETPRLGQGSEFIQGDIRKIEDVRKALAGKNVKTIISLAAKHHDFGIGHQEYFDTNEEGTEVICRAAAENDITDIIFYSSVAVYGLRSDVSSEQTEAAPDAAYGKSKLAGEKVLGRWAAADPRRKVTIIRPTLVYGANNRANMYNLIRQIDSGWYFHLGKADNIKSIAYVENLVQATLFLKDRMKPGVAIYNYADEPQLTTRMISEKIASEFNKKIALTVPKTLGVIMGLPFDLAIKITGKNLPISSARIQKLATQTYHGAHKIFSEGFKPTFTTLQGLTKMVDWYKTQSDK